MPAGNSIVLLGPPGSGKSTLAYQALKAEGSGLVALAPGLDEEASYSRLLSNEAYRIKGFDDPEFYPDADSMKATGYDELLSWLRGIYVTLKKELDAGEPLRFNILVTDTFNSMSQLAMNKTMVKLNMQAPPPAMSPTGAAYWGYFRNQQDALMRACRAVKGLGVTWIATCHIAEKEMKETAVANPENIASKASGFVPAIQGGFRDTFAAAFNLVLYTGVQRVAPIVANGVTTPQPPLHYLQWRSDPKRPTKSRIGSLADGSKIPANWLNLKERIATAEARD